jgi:hypothetical protein
MLKFSRIQNEQLTHSLFVKIGLFTDKSIRSLSMRLLISDTPLYASKTKKKLKSHVSGMKPAGPLNFKQGQWR